MLANLEWIASRPINKLIIIKTIMMTLTNQWSFENTVSGGALSKIHRMHTNAKVNSIISIKINFSGLSGKGV